MNAITNNLRTWPAKDLLMLARAAGMLWDSSGRSDPLDMLNERQRALLDRAAAAYLTTEQGGLDAGEYLRLAEAGDEAELPRLVQLARDGDLEPDDLDHPVFQLAGRYIGWVPDRDAALDAQVRFLLTAIGPAKAKQVIQAAIDALAGSQDGDVFIVLDRGRYFVSLGRASTIEPASQPRNGYPDPGVAIYEAALLMAEHGEFPGVWMCGEHGPSERDVADEVRAFHDAGGDQMRPLEGVTYEPGTEVRSNDGTWEVIRDYGELGVWLGVYGDRSAGERFTQHELTERADLLSEARGWIADCGLIRGEVADLADSEVKRITSQLYEGGWVQFTRDYDAGQEKPS